jgi:hypothetical protein
MFLEKAASSCPLDADPVRFSRLFGTCSFVLLCAASRRKHGSAFYPRFNIRPTIANITIGSVRVFLKQKNEKTSDVRAQMAFGGVPRKPAASKCQLKKVRRSKWPLLSPPAWRRPWPLPEKIRAAILISANKTGVQPGQMAGCSLLC